MPGGNFGRFPSIVEPAATRPRLWWQTGTPDAVAGCVFGQVSERDGEVLAPDEQRERRWRPPLFDQGSSVSPRGDPPLTAELDEKR